MDTFSNEQRPAPRLPGRAGLPRGGPGREADAIITTDAGGSVVSLNEAAQVLTGWSNAEAAGRPVESVFRIVDRSDHGPIESPVARALAECVVVGLPDRVLVVARDGTTHPIDDGSPPIRGVVPIHDAEGRVVGAVLVFSDIVERSRRPHDGGDALARSEQRYRRLFESAKDGILILNAATARVVDANPFLAELLGFPPSQLLGKELWEIGLFSDIDACALGVKELQEVGYLRYDHLPLVAHDGSEVEVEVVSNVYAEGDAQVIQCNVRDITDRRRLERRAAEQAESLATLNRRKDEFLAMLSHELRNPLASILNCIQIFQLHPESDPTQRHAKGILERQVGQMTHLVDDLLESSRITSGNFSLHVARCDLRIVAIRSIESIRPMIDRKGHHFSTSIPPEPIWLEADSDRLEQVIVNLLSNSAKYSDPGSKIMLSLRREGAEAVLRVRDTGIGISPKVLPRVFDLFSQADRSLDRSQGGIGVGLTLVLRLVAMHGGSVEAHSAGLGEGSEFIVRLPAAPGLPPMGPPGPGPPGSTEDPPPPVRVLVVDDNVDYADGVAMLLRSAGYQVEVVHNGPEALESVIASRPDVVVLDIGLPGMDGYEVARRIRLLPGHEHLRIVAVSGYRQDPPAHDPGAARFDRYLLKPILMDDLKSHLVEA